MYLVSRHLFSVFCTTYRNPEGKGGLLEEVWDEEDKSKEFREERVTGLQSGFDRLNMAGYREAILGEFDNSEELGRQGGFQQGFVANPEANPTFALACMEGQLMALSHRSGLGGTQTEVSCCLNFVSSNIFFCYQFPFLFNQIPCSIVQSAISLLIIHLSFCILYQRGEEQQLLEEVKALMDICYNNPPYPAAAESDSQQWCDGKFDCTRLRQLQRNINKLYLAHGWTLPSLP